MCIHVSMDFDVVTALYYTVKGVNRLVELKKKRGRKPKEQPPIQHYVLSEEELQKYRDMPVPKDDVRLRITAARSNPSSRKGNTK